MKTRARLFSWIRFACLTFLVVLATMVFSGCQTMAGWFGVASEPYVDERIDESQTRMGEIEGQLNEMQSRLGEMQARVDESQVAAAQLEELIGSLETTVQTTEELKQLATVLEDRLSNLPDETIRQLVEVLQGYLESK